MAAEIDLPRVVRLKSMIQSSGSGANKGFDYRPVIHETAMPTYLGLIGEISRAMTRGQR